MVQRLLVENHWLEFSLFCGKAVDLLEIHLTPPHDVTSADLSLGTPVLILTHTSTLPHTFYIHENQVAKKIWGHWVSLCFLSELPDVMTQWQRTWRHQDWKEKLLKEQSLLHMSPNSQIVSSSWFTYSIFVKMNLKNQFMSAENNPLHCL
jgi:hypothetical protein